MRRAVCLACLFVSSCASAIAEAAAGVLSEKTSTASQSEAFWPRVTRQLCVKSYNVEHCELLVEVGLAGDRGAEKSDAARDALVARDKAELDYQMAMRRFEDSTSTSPVADDAAVLQQELDQSRQEFARYRGDVTVLTAGACIIMASIAMAFLKEDRPQLDQERPPNKIYRVLERNLALLLGGAVGTYWYRV